MLNFKIIALFLISILMCACFQVKDVNSLECSNCSLTISTDQSLSISYFDPTVPATPTLSGITPIAGGIVPSGSGTTPAISGQTFTDTSSASSLAGSAPVIDLAPNSDMTSSFSANITLTASNLANYQLSCSINAPLSITSCDGNSFSLDSSDITNSGSLRINLKGKDQKEYQANVNSNSIDIERLVLRQISNTSGNQLTGDAPISFTEYNNELYFVASNQNGRYKLYKYNGISVTQVSNTSTDQNTVDFPSDLTIYDNTLYFISNNSNGHKRIFKYDGTDLTQFSNIPNDHAVDSDINSLHLFGSHLYFVADGPSSSDKIYKASSSSISMFSNTAGALGSTDNPEPFINFNNEFYFKAHNQNVAVKIFKTNGDSITQFSNIVNNQNLGDQDIRDPIVYNNELYFVASTVSGTGIRKLFKTDGTNIYQVSNTRGNSSLSDLPYPQIIYNNEFYFTSYNQNGATKLFKTNGTTVSQVSNTAEDQTEDDATQYFVEYNNELYFIAKNANNRNKLYKYDGTSVTQVSNTRNDQTEHDFYLNGSDPSNTTLHVYAGALYFPAFNDSGNTKLFRLKDNEIHQVSNIIPGSNDIPILDFLSSTCTEIKAIGQHLYIVMHSPDTPGTDTFCNEPTKLYSLCDPSAGCTP